MTPPFAVWAIVQRVREAPALPPRTSQRRLTLAIGLLAAAGPLLWILWLLLFLHQNTTLLSILSAVSLLCLFTSVPLALTGRGPGRRPVLSAYALLLVIAIAIILWAFQAEQTLRDQPFWSSLTPPIGCNHPNL